MLLGQRYPLQFAKTHCPSIERLAHDHYLSTIMKWIPGSANDRYPQPTSPLLPVNRSQAHAQAFFQVNTFQHRESSTASLSYTPVMPWHDHSNTNSQDSTLTPSYLWVLRPCAAGDYSWKQVSTRPRKASGRACGHSTSVGVCKPRSIYCRPEADPTWWLIVGCRGMCFARDRYAHDRNMTC